MPDVVLSRYDVELPSNADQMLPSTPTLPSYGGAGRKDTAAVDFSAALNNFDKQAGESDLAGVLNTPLASALQPAMRYTDPEIGYNPFDTQLEYKYADAHPWQTLGNNLLQFGARFGGAFIEAIATIPLGINAVINKDFSKLYDNDLTNGITSWLDELNDSIPAYRSQYEDEHPVLKYLNILQPSAMLGAWGGAINNLGYTAGAITGAIVEDAIIGVMTGGAGLPAAFVANGAQLARALGKVEKAVAAGTDLAVATKNTWGVTRGAARVAEAGELATTGGAAIRAEGTGMFQSAGRTESLLSNPHTAQGVVNRMSRLAQVRDGVRYHLALLTSAAAEGSFEAAETYHRGVDDLKMEFSERYGRDAVGDELKQIQSVAKEASDFTMGANIALLYASNRVNWGSLFKSTNQRLGEQFITGWGKNIGRERVVGKLGNVVDDAGKTIDKEIAYSVVKTAPETRIGKILLNAEKVVRIGMRPINESIEEGSQFTVSEGSLAYAKAKYDPYVMKETASLLSGLKDGLDKTIHTNEGWDNMVGGFVGGLLGGGVMSRINGKKGSPSEQLAQQMKLLNTSKFNGVLADRFGAAVTQNSLNKRYEEELKQGDIFAAHNTHYDMLFNWVSSGMKANAYERRMQELEILKGLTGQDFKEKWGVEDNAANREQANEFLDGMASKAEEIKVNVEKVNRITKNPYKSTDVLKYAAYESYKDELAHNLSAFTEYQRRINGMTGELKEHFPLMDINKAIRLTSVQGMSQVLTEVQKASDQLAKQIAATTENETLQNELFLKKTALDKLFSRMQAIVYSGKTQTSKDSVTGEATTTGRTTNVQFNGKEFLDVLSDLYDLHNGTSFEQNAYTQRYLEDNSTDTGVVRIGPRNEQLTDADTKADLLEKLQDIYKLGDASSNASKYYRYLRTGVGATEMMRTMVETARKAATIINTAEQEKYSAEREETIRAEEMADIVTDPEEDEPVAKEEEPIIRKAAEKIVKKKPLTKEEEDIVAKKPKVFTKYVKAERRTQSRLEEEGLGEENANPSATPNKSNGKINPYTGIHPRNLFGMFSQDLGTSKNRSNLHKLLYVLSRSAADVTKNLRATFTKEVEPTSDKLTAITNTKLWRKQFEENLNILNGEDQIGILRPPTTVYLDEAGTRSIYDITKEEYSDLTGNQSNTYEDFMKQINLYRESYNKLRDSIKAGESVDAATITELFNLTVMLGSAKHSKDPKADIKLGDLTNLPAGSAIISIDSKGKVTILNQVQLGAHEAGKLARFLQDNKSIIGQAYRYAVVIPILGEYRSMSVLFARNAETSIEERNEFFNAIKTVASSQLSEEEANTVLADLANKFYVTTSREAEGTHIDFRFDDTFTPHIRVYNRERKVVEEIPIDKAKIQQSANYKELIAIMNAAIKTAVARQSVGGKLASLNLNLTEDNVKRQIPDNAEVKDIKSLNDVLKLATSRPDIFENYNIHFDGRPDEAGTQPATTQSPITPSPAPIPPANTLPQDLRGAKPRYSYSNNNYEIVFASDIDKAAYIIAQKTKSKRDADYLKFVMEAAGFTEAEARQMGADVRDQIKMRVLDGSAVNGVVTLPVLYKKKAQPAIPTVQFAENRDSLITILKNIFNLPQEQAEATADIYERVAQAWAARTGRPVQDYFKEIGFSDTLDTAAPQADILNQHVADVQKVVEGFGLTPKYSNSLFVGYTSTNALAGRALLTGVQKWIDDNSLNAAVRLNATYGTIELRPKVVQNTLFQVEASPEIDRAIEIVKEGSTLTGYLGQVLQQAASNDRALFVEYLNEFADQLNDPESNTRTIKVLGQELSDLAVKVKADNILYQKGFQSFIQEYHPETFMPKTNSLSKKEFEEMMYDLDNKPMSLIDYIGQTTNENIKNKLLIENKDTLRFALDQDNLLESDKSTFVDFIKFYDAHKDKYVNWANKNKELYKRAKLYKNSNISYQNARGAFDKVKRIIYGLTDPRIDTPIHELAHSWEEMLTAEERQQVLDWAGHKTWTRATSEKFADGFTVYMSEGNKTNSPELTSLFDKFAKWLADVYKDVAAALGIELNDNMRTIYSSMLNSEFVSAKTKAGIIAYHGSMTRFEKFSVAKAMESDGTRLMGQGIYFFTKDNGGEQNGFKYTVKIKDFKLDKYIPYDVDKLPQATFDKLQAFFKKKYDIEITNDYFELIYLQVFEKNVYKEEGEFEKDIVEAGFSGAYMNGSAVADGGNAKSVGQEIVVYDDTQIEIIDVTGSMTNDIEIELTTKDQEVYTVAINNNGEKVGEIKAFNDGEYLNVNEANINTPRQGIGIEAYRQLAREAEGMGLTLRSDSIKNRLSPEAVGLWEKLVAAGEAIKAEDNYVYQGKEQVAQTAKEQIIAQREQEIAQAEAELQEAIDALPMPGEIEESDYNDQVSALNGIHSRAVNEIKGRYQEQLDILEQPVVEQPATEEPAAPAKKPKAPRKSRAKVKIVEETKTEVGAFQQPVEEVVTPDEQEVEQPKVPEVVEPETLAIPVQYVSYTTPNGEVGYGVVSEIDGTMLTITPSTGGEIYRSASKVNMITEGEYAKVTQPEVVFNYNGKEYKPRYQEGQTVVDNDGDVHQITSVEIIADTLVDNNKITVEDFMDTKAKDRAEGNFKKKTIILGTRDVQDNVKSARIIYTMKDGTLLAEEGIQRRVFTSGQDQKELKAKYNTQIKSMERVLSRLSQFFGGIRYEYVELPFDAPARFYKGIVQVNLIHIEKLTRNSHEILVHEFIHPFVKALSLGNKQLYDKLAADLTTNYSNVLDEARGYYKESDYAATDLMDEALTLHLGRTVASAFKNLNENNLVSILYSDTTTELREDGIHNVLYKGEIIGEVNTPTDYTTIQKIADKHAYTLNPLTKVRKNLYVKFRDWFNNVVSMIKEQKAPRTVEQFVKAANASAQKDFRFELRNNENASLEVEQIGTSPITIYIDPSFVRDSYDIHNIMPIVRRLEGSEIKGSRTEFTRGHSLELESLIDQYFFGKSQPVTKNTFTTSKLHADMTLEDLGNFIAKQLADGDIIDGFNFDTAELDAFDEMEAYFNLTDTQLEAMRKRIVNKFDLLEETANKRINSETLTIQKNAARKLGFEKDDLQFMLHYMENAAVSINLAYVKYAQLLEKLNNNKGVMGRVELNALNKEFAVLRQLLSYYDQFSSYNQFEDYLNKENGAKDFSYYAKAFGKQQQIREGMQDLATKLTVEWLMPYADLHSKLMKEQGYTDEQYEITYDKLYKLFRYGGGRDTNYITFWLGSNVTSRDPINAIFANTLADMLSLNNIKITQKADDFSVAFDAFVTTSGIPLSAMDKRQQYYKDNFLRKVKIKMVDTDKDTDEKVERIVEKWALHQEFKLDEYELDLQAEQAKYSNPRSSAEEDEFNEKLTAWKVANKNGKVEKYRNPDYAKAAANPFFKAIESSYNDSNLRYGTNQLRYGIIPQKYEISFTEKLKRASELFKGDNKARNLKEAAVETFASVQSNSKSYNLDGSVYQNINTTLTTIKEEENISLILEEIIPSFIVESNNYTTLKETQYNAETLMLLLEGNHKLGITPRTFAEQDFNSKVRQPFELAKLGDRLKEMELLRDSKDPSFDATLYDKLKEKYDKGVQPFSLWDKMAKRFSPSSTSYNNEKLIGMIKDRYYGESVEDVKVGRISATQAAHYLRLFTSINNMAGNYIAGLGNITIGNTQLFIEAHGGKYFTKGDLAKATGDYLTNIPQYMADMQRPIKSKDTQLSIMLDAIQGEIEDEFGLRVTGNIARKMFRTSSLFLFTKAGEHQIQITNMKAMMLGRKVKTNKGEEITLYDAFVTDEQGRVNLRKDIQFSEEDLTKFIRDMHGVNRMLNGNYSNLHKTMLQRKWYGNLLLSYRKYIYPSVRARYASEHVDFERNTVEVGYLRYGAKYFLKGMTNIVTGKGGFEKFKDLKPHQRYALRKTTAELGMYAGLTALTVGIFGSGDDDKKKELTDAQKFGLLMLLRLRSDIGLYHWDMPSEMIKQLKNPTASLQTVVGVFNVVSQLTTAPFEQYQQDVGSHSEGDSKLAAKARKLIPIISKFQSTLDDKLGYMTLLRRNVGTFVEDVTPKNDLP